MSSLFVSQHGGQRPLVAASGRFSAQHVQGLKFLESAQQVAAFVGWPQVAAFVG